MDRQPPAAALGGRVERQGEGPAPRALVGQRIAPRLHAVGAGDDGGQGQALHGPYPCVARQHRGEDRLAGAIGAALGREVHVHGRRGGSTLHPPVAQVEPRLRQRQEGEICPRLCRDERGLRPAPPAQQAGIEARHARRIRLGRAQHVVVARDQRHLHPGERRGGGQRPQEHVQPVRPLQGREAEIGHHEPLGRHGRPGVRLAVGQARGHGVEPGRQPRQRFPHRQRGDDVGVQGAGRQLAPPRPDRLAEVRPQDGLLDPRQHAAEIAVSQDGGQVARPDPVDLQRHLGQVHRADRDRRRGAARQHISPAEEARGGAAVADVEDLLHRRRQPLSRGGRQAGAQRHAIGLAMGKPLDAELAVAGLHREIPAGHDHVIGVVHSGRREIFRHLEARPWAGRLRVHLPVEHPEPVEPGKARDLGFRRRGGRQPRGQAHRVEPAPPLARRLQRQPQRPSGGRAPAPQPGVDRRRDAQGAHPAARVPVLRRDP